MTPEEKLAQRRARYAKRKDAVNAQARAAYAQQRDKKVAYHQAYRATHPTQILEAGRRWNAKHPEQRQATTKRWHADNAAALAEYCKKRHQTHWWEQALGHARQHTNARNARGRNHKVTIFASYLQYLWNLQQGKCYWSGLPLSTESRNQLRVSLDRLDNTRGYEPGNVVLAAWCINRFRGDMTPEEFRAMLWRLRELT